MIRRSRPRDFWDLSHVVEHEMITYPGLPDRRSATTSALTARRTATRRYRVVACGSFALTFGLVRALTHWIRNGHGSAGGGMSFGGAHFVTTILVSPC